MTATTGVSSSQTTGREYGFSAERFGGVIGRKAVELWEEAVDQAFSEGVPTDEDSEGAGEWRPSVVKLCCCSESWSSRTDGGRERFMIVIVYV
jgi:hypothetical protein